MTPTAAPITTVNRTIDHARRRSSASNCVASMPRPLAAPKGGPTDSTVLYAPRKRLNEPYEGPAVLRQAHSPPSRVGGEPPTDFGRPARVDLRSAGAVALEHRRNRAREQLGVEPQRPLRRVHEIEPAALREANGAAA